MSIYKKAKTESLNSLMETIYWQQRAFHNYQEWEDEQYENIHNSMDLVDSEFKDLESKLKAQQELIDELSELVKEISERLNENSRVAIHKDSIVHVRMKRAIAKIEVR